MGNVEAALELAEKLQNQGYSIPFQVFNIKARYFQLKTSHIKRVITDDFYTIELNKINDALLQSLQQAESNNSSESRLNLFFFSILGILIALLVIVGLQIHKEETPTTKKEEISLHEPIESDSQKTGLPVQTPDPASEKSHEPRENTSPETATPSLPDNSCEQKLTYKFCMDYGQSTGDRTIQVFAEGKEIPASISYFFEKTGCDLIEVSVCPKVSSLRFETQHCKVTTYINSENHALSPIPITCQ